MVCGCLPALYPEEKGRTVPCGLTEKQKEKKKFHFPTTQNEIFMYNREVGENRNPFYEQPACKET